MIKKLLYEFMSMVEDNQVEIYDELVFNMNWVFS